MQILGLIVLLGLPAAWCLWNRSAVPAAVGSPAAAAAAREGKGAAINRALSDPSYLMCFACCFVCGFTSRSSVNNTRMLDSFAIGV